MIDFAEPLIIPRPKTRIMDKLIDLINAAIPYIIAGLIGAALGVGQGYIQADKSWRDKVVERSHADAYGQSLAIHEDENGVYYSHMERRR